MPVSLPSFDFASSPRLGVGVLSTLRKDYSGALVVRLSADTRLGASARVVPAGSVGFVLSLRGVSVREAAVWFPWVSTDCHGVVPLSACAPIARFR